MILVDTCVLIDVFDDDPTWSDWSRRQLDTWAGRGPLVINPVIYAELAADFDSIESLDGVIDRAELEIREMPREALYLAGQGYLQYRRRGGTRAGLLSDFFIGAHAAVLNVPLFPERPHMHDHATVDRSMTAPDPVIPSSKLSNAPQKALAAPP